jgi:dTDP-glucose 4,6-dehydratase
MDWEGKRVLVTGAGGFIGSHLAERLVESGAQVRSLVQYNSTNRRGWLDDSELSERMDVRAGNICDADSVDGAVAGMDVVFHLAALIAIPYSYDAPISYVRTNVEGTLNVMNACRRHGVSRVVHTSTSETYGTAQYVPVDEKHPLVGQSPYAASKIGGDKVAESFHLSFDLPVATIRPFNTFGPRQSLRAVVPTIIAQALTADQVALGNLEATRDLTYVADTVEGFLAVGAHPAAIGEVHNIGSGREVSVLDLAKTILQVVGRSDVPVVVAPERLRPAASEVDRLLASNERARTRLGWEPRWTLEEGLEKTVAWVRQNLDAYRAPTTYVV